MTEELQTALKDEQEGPDNEDRELEEAEEEFKEELGSDIVDVTEPKKEETAKEYQDILIALGFTRYDNKEKGIACKLKVGQLLIGRTFTETHPIGNMWVQCLSDGEHGKKGEFLKRDECKQIPQVNLFYSIRDGELAIPRLTVTGKVVGKSEKAIQIQFDEFGLGQYETQWWGFGALKKTEDGINYVPGSYSKETEKYTAKMQIPRNIILEKYEEELAEAPLTTSTDTGEHKEESKEEVEKSTVAGKIPAPESREEAIANIMKTYLEKGREMVEQIFPELEQPQLSELSQDIATSMFIEDRKEARKERW